MKSSDKLALTNRPLDGTIAWLADKPLFVEQFLAQAHWLSSRLPSGRYVINMQTDRYRYLLGFCASVMAGQCTLMPPNRLDNTLNELTMEYAESFVLLPGDALLEECMSASIPSQPVIPEIPADQLSAIAFTSGSTGKPNPNPKYWETVVVGTANNIRLLEMTRGGRLNLVTTVPCQHMWGMETAILSPLWSGTAVSSAAPFYPQDIADALSRIPAPRALVSSPVHLEVLLRSDVEVPPVEMVYSATSPLSQELAVALEERLHARVREVFGCSETGIIAARDTARELLWTVGEALTLAPCKEGILVEGDHLPKSVLLPDHIELTGRKQFKWIGRHQDMIKIAGKRASLAEINQALKKIDGISDGVIFLPETDADSIRLAALIVSGNLDKVSFRQELARYIDPVFLPRPVYFVKQLPRQETGKLSRTEIMKLFHQQQRQ